MLTGRGGVTAALVAVLTVTGCSPASSSAPEPAGSPSTPARVEPGEALLAVVGRFAPDGELLPALRCSATLIGERVAVTARHCLTGEDLDVVQAVDVCRGPVQRRHATPRATRPGWGDVAVLDLDGPLTGPVLKAGAPPSPGTRVEVAGFGHGLAEPPSCTGRPARLEVTDCLRDAPVGSWCAVPLAGERNTCQRDSGAGVFEGSVLVGVVSSGPDCAPGSVGFYAALPGDLLDPADG